MRHLVGGIAISLMFLAWLNSRNFLYALLHLHNLIAIGIWWGWKRKRAWWEGVTLLLCGLCSAFILLAPIEAWAYNMPHPNLLDPEYFQQTLAPFASKEHQFRLVVLYAFLQSFHYLIWIKLIPEEASHQHTPQSFRKSLLDLHKDLGSWFLLCTTISMIGLLVWAVFNIQTARAQYLWFISFHGFMELAVCAYLLCKDFE